MFIGSIDQGTSSSRFILFDVKGKPVASHQLEIVQHYPKPGWVEHDPMNILDTVMQCIEATLTKAKVKPHQVRAVGITNQRETTVVWDKVTGKPLHNAIVWLDTRSRDIVDRLIDNTGSGDTYRRVCGLPFSTYFSAMKLLWLMENVPAVSSAISEGRALFGTIDSWLIWNLTGGTDGGVHATDVSNASRTMLMSLNTLNWDVRTCQELGIPLTVLPSIRSNSELFGKIRRGGLTGVPITGCLGDQQAAMVGQLCLTAGSAKNTYGTGCFMLMNTGSKVIQSDNGLLTTVAFQLGKQSPVCYALEGSVAVAGSAVKWLRDQLKLIATAPEINEVASQAEVGSSGVYFVPAFSGLLSPYWRTDARGVIVGITHYTNRSHIARAALEASCYQSKEVLDAMQQDSHLDLKLLKVDGGLCQSDLMVQFQADILRIPVHRPRMMEATAAGAAFAAGLAVGFWTSIADLRAKTQADGVDVFEPTLEAGKAQTLFDGWKRAVQRSFDLAQAPPPSSKL